MATQGKKKQNRIRRDDKVRVLAGEHRDAEGKVTRILADNSRVEVEIDGLAEDDMIVKHQKRSTEFPNGTRLHLNPTIHISNVMKLDRWKARIKLTEEQQKMMAEIRKAQNEANREISQNKDLTPQDKRDQMNDLREGFKQQIEDIYTAEQKAEIAKAKKAQAERMEQMKKLRIVRQPVEGS